MGITGKEPGKGRGKKITRWVYLPVPCSSTAVGFLAAHPVGIWSHWVGVSKPCRRLMTDGELSCSFCAGGEDPVWRGYTAIYDRDYARRFVMIAEDMLEAVREIAVGSQIKIARAKGTREGITIRADVWRTQPLPKSVDREGEIDMIPSLLVLWKYPELIEWHARSVVPIIGEPTDGTRRRQVPATLEGSREQGKRELQSGAAIIANALRLGRMSEEDAAPALVPERNGKHKPR